ncbi:murein L,D-transpeptidase catalytic domain-containing protein [Novosphingobium chloroacetimidivorans]|uniref:murein L,D-transpeptidase catalytic domain-containing protein n=1 Tax=Novosphingobium chloroacetimidivorans TaxID=1428314 RepID=UPI0028AFA9A1|nr:murein L,D-transpeptidase catalytic domain family protein [Novosphingobium chloroacetimidivorans]
MLGRRDVLKGTMAIGAGLAASGWAVPGLAQGLPGPLQSPGVQPAGAPLPPGAAVPGMAPVSPAAALPTSPVGTPEYNRRILANAKRQVERLGSKLWRTDVVGMADFSRPSWEPRMHFANLENGTVRSFLLAHGKGSDLDHTGWLQTFSSQYGSLATSRGAYLTCEWYTGKYGTSIRLVGLDPDNRTALERMIVMHSAWYVDPGMIAKWGKIGRSDGCFAMSQTDFNEALWHLSGGRLLFADRIV